MKGEGMRVTAGVEGTKEPLFNALVTHISFFRDDDGDSARKYIVGHLGIIYGMRLREQRGKRSSERMINLSEEGGKEAIQ